jgi:hypothetical protein
VIVPLSATRVRIEGRFTYPAEGVTFEPATTELEIQSGTRPE